MSGILGHQPHTHVRSVRVIWQNTVRGGVGNLLLISPIFKYWSTHRVRVSSRLYFYSSYDQHKIEVKPLRTDIFATRCLCCYRPWPFTSILSCEVEWRQNLQAAWRRPWTWWLTLTAAPLQLVNAFKSNVCCPCGITIQYRKGSKGIVRYNNAGAWVFVQGGSFVLPRHRSWQPRALPLWPQPPSVYTSSRPFNT